MRSALGLVSLVVVLAVVGLLVKKQLTGYGQIAAPVPSTVPATGNPAQGATDTTVKQPSQQIQQQYKQALEGALQAPRPMGDEK